MILAGPGSGKTTVITRRVQCLIEEYHVNPVNILVITFSRAAAAEMRERFHKLTGGRNDPVTFGTFHAVYFQILKHAYGYTGANIVKEEQRVQFVREFLHRLRLETDNEAELITNILHEIGLVKESGIPPEHYYSSSCPERVFRNLFYGYQEFLDQNRLLDFDDMLVYTKELLEARPDILAGWQQRFRYILIDEFQDINRIQYDIIRLLAKPENNLFIVGDDDQSIYRFRGASPEIMLHFEEDFPGTQRVLLDTNYRSGREIVRQAGNVISHNRNRFSKEIRATSPIKGIVKELEFGTQREENRFVISELGRLNREENLTWSDMAILFRTNSQPGLLIQQLFEYNLPFTAREHIPNLYDHWIARDVCTYIRLALGDRSRASFLRIMNRPNRYLSRESLPYEQVSFEIWKQFYSAQGWMMQRLEKLESDLRVLRGMRPFSAVTYIRKAVSYEEFLRDFAKEHHMPPEDLLDVLDEIQEDAKSFASYEEWFAHMDAVRAEWKEKDQHRQPPSDSVQLATLHGAKGLEFDTVFILDVNEKVMPYKKAVLEADLEEERRMFYVGMTRAKRRLYLLHPQKIRTKETEPSRFLAECGNPAGSRKESIPYRKRNGF